MINEKAFNLSVIDIKSIIKISDLIIIVISVILLMSTWGSILIKIKGFYIPEVLIIPLSIYVFFRNPNIIKIVRHWTLSRIGLSLTFWLFCMALIGIINTGSFTGPYSELRASLILIYVFIYMYNLKENMPEISNILLWLSFSVLCLDSLLVLLQTVFRDFVSLPLFYNSAGDQEEVIFGFGRASIPSITILVTAYLSSRKLRIFTLILTIIIGGILSLGGHRIVLVVTIISALFIPICILNISLINKRKSNYLKILQIFVLLYLIVIILKLSFIQNYLSVAEGIRYRLLIKTVDAIEAVRRGDSIIDYGEEGIRVAYFSYIIENSPMLLLPHGLGSREVYGKIGNKFNEIAKRFGASGEHGNTHDLAILYLVYHHGLIVSGILIGCLIVLIYFRLKFARNYVDKIYIIIALMGIITIDLTYPPVPGINIAFFYGVFLGYLLNWRSTISYNYTNNMIND